MTTAAITPSSPSPEVVRETQSLTASAKAMTVSSQADYDKVIEVGKTIKAMRKKIEEHYTPIKRSIDASKKAVLDAERESLKPVEDAEFYLGTIATNWRGQESRRLAAIAEEERLRQVKLAEDEKLARASRAEAKGKGEQVVDRILSEPIVTAPIKVAEVARAGEARAVAWKFRVTDLSKVPREFMQLDEVAVGAFVRAKKQEGEVISGIEAYSEEKTRF